MVKEREEVMHSLESKRSISEEEYDKLFFADSYTGDLNRLELAHYRLGVFARIDPQSDGRGPVQRVEDAPL